MKVIPLPWDSTFFGLKIGELSIDDNVSRNVVVKDDFDLIYVKMEKESEIWIDGFTESYSETKVVFEKNDFTENHDISDSIKDVHEVAFDAQALYRLALESGRFSRFKMDPNFAESSFKKLYRTWIDNALSKSYDDGLLVAMDESDVIGFVTYRVFSDFANIGLVAIDPESQGKGTGTQLIRAVERRIVKSGIHTLRIPTQLKNEQACNFYKKLGYSATETTQIKHFWRDPL